MPDSTAHTLGCSIDSPPSSATCSVVFRSTLQRATVANSRSTKRNGCANKPSVTPFATHARTSHNDSLTLTTSLAWMCTPARDIPCAAAAFGPIVSSGMRLPTSPLRQASSDASS